MFINVIICYDITNGKIRNKISKLLQKYLFRTQKSFFEGELNNNDLKNIISEIKGNINLDTDSVYIIYPERKTERYQKRFDNNLYNHISDIII